ncbi:hypothetical protein [Zobellella sp. An-6]|uniref:hypothetical protein n=1 Tax=Zobellella sp. An-6 TaxID=3400218 RepID=UPI004041DE14
MKQETQILLESLRRTDSFILSADQKASFCLAAGITFIGIYSTLFYSVINDEKTVIPTTLICAIIGLTLVPWIMFFNSIRNVFSPNLEPSESKSIISFASIKNGFSSLDDFKSHYNSLNGKDFHSIIEIDILENHWICSGICMAKMGNFKKGLYWLWISLTSSIFGLAILVFFSEHSAFVNILNVCK